MSDIFPAPNGALRAFNRAYAPFSLSSLIHDQKDYGSLNNLLTLICYE